MDSRLRDHDLNQEYWHAPFVLPDGRRILPTRSGNAVRVPQRARLLRSLLRTACDTLSSKSVLDLACAEGYFSHVAIEMGARRVLGIDCNEVEIAKATWIRDQLGLKNIEFQCGDVTAMELPESDVVLCLGFFYHVQDPFALISKLGEVTRELLIIDTDVLPLPDTLARLEIEEVLPWSKSRVATWSMSFDALSAMAAASDFTKCTRAKVTNDAPVDYRSARRIMAAFHKSGESSLSFSNCLRPTDDRRSAPFSRWYGLGTIAYKAIGYAIKILKPLTRRW